MHRINLLWQILYVWSLCIWSLRDNVKLQCYPSVELLWERSDADFSISLHPPPSQFSPETEWLTTSDWRMGERDISWLKFPNRWPRFAIPTNVLTASLGDMREMNKAFKIHITTTQLTQQLTLRGTEEDNKIHDRDHLFVRCFQRY